MKAKIAIVSLFALVTASLWAQNDPQAKAILDKVSAKSKSYKTISASFVVVGSNVKSQDKTTQKGTMLIKGDKYVIKMAGNETYFDGKDVYNYLPSAKEVNISKPGKKANKSNDFFISNPKEIFQLYTKDFKYKFIKESATGSQTLYEIDLYPNDLNKNYSRVRLQIDQKSENIVSIKTFMKDGQQYLVTLDNFETNKDLPDASFKFDSAKHPEVEVIDLRF